MNIDLQALPERIATKLHYEPTTGCLLWTGCASRGGRCGGYGSVRWRGQMRQAHRVVYELLVRGGERLPDDLTLDHVKARGCSTILCCNPDHLEPVSRGENNRRSTCHHNPKVKGRWSSRSNPLADSYAHASDQNAHQPQGHDDRDGG